MDTIPYEEMAQRLHVSVKTVRKAVREGQFPSILVGRRRKVLRQPFESMLRSRTNSEAQSRIASIATEEAKMP